MVPYEEYLKCTCGLIASATSDVIDLAVSATNSFEIPIDHAAKGIISSLRLPETSKPFISELLTTRPDTRTRSFFDAEEELLLDRFNQTNFEPRLQLGPAYSASTVSRSLPFSVALRVKNLGAFDVSSNACPPVFITYHWLDRFGHVIHFEGSRSALPVVLKPGMEVTVLVDVVPPPTLDSTHEELTLRFHVIKELVERYAAVYDHVVRLSEDKEQSPIDRSDGRPFSETLDGQLGAQFLRSHLSPQDLVIEIGGGLRPLYYDSFPANQEVCFVNNDASLSLLRLAKHLHPREGIMLRADATRLPFFDNTASAVIFARAMHHFPNLYEQFKEVHRILRPNGKLFLICEPVGSAYDDHVRALIASGVNEQIFPQGAYDRLAKETGFLRNDCQLDWGFSFKGAFSALKANRN
jgi:SAM-dependent methyltransferase